MTLEQYIIKVWTGEITLPPAMVYTPEVHREIISKDPDFGDMEPDTSLRCLDGHASWVCTRTRGHLGRHVARRSQGIYCDDWANEA